MKNGKPETVRETVNLLLISLSDENRQAIRSMPEEELISLHFGLGAGIRNEFGLWKDNKELLKLCGKENPDDASTVIIKALWQRLKVRE